MSAKLDKVLESVQKNFKVDIPSARESGIVERLVLDSPGLNYAFGGGMPLGRAMFFHGPESGGKTTLATYLASQVQKKRNKAVLFMDYEYTFESSHAEELGLDIDNNFILVRPLNAEDGFNMMKEFIDSGELGLVIIDSVTAMSSKSAVEGDAFSGFAGGKTAAAISMGIKMLLPYLYNNKCSLIMLSQERANIGAMYGPDYKVTGGKAPGFYSTWSARITRTGDITDSNTKELCGIEMRVRNVKNKVGIAKRDANLKLLFKSGINSEEEYLDYLVNLGIIKKNGAMYEVENDTWGMGRVRGIEAVKTFLKTHEDIYEKVKSQVNELIAGHNILDENAVDDGLIFDEDTGEILNPEVLEN